MLLDHLNLRSRIALRISAKPHFLCRAHGKKPRSKPDSYDILDVMEDLLDDFGEMVDEQFPQQSRDRIESFESDKEEKYSSDKSNVRRTKSFKENPTTSKFSVEVTKKPSNQYTRRQTEGNLTFGDVGDLVNRKSRVERSKSLKGSSLSNLRLLELICV